MKLDEQFATRKEVLAELHISPETLRRWEKAGLPVHRPGGSRNLYDRDEVARFIRSRCSDPSAGEAA